MSGCSYVGCDSYSYQIAKGWGGCGLRWTIHSLHVQRANSHNWFLVFGVESKKIFLVSRKERQFLVLSSWVDFSVRYMQHDLWTNAQFRELLTQWGELGQGASSCPFPVHRCTTAAYAQAVDIWFNALGSECLAQRWPFQTRRRQYWSKLVLQKSRRQFGERMVYHPSSQLFCVLSRLTCLQNQTEISHLSSHPENP